MKRLNAAYAYWLIPLFFMLFSFPLGAQRIDVVGDPGLEELFESSLSAAIERLRSHHREQPSKFRAVNQSIKNTLEAVNLIQRNHLPKAAGLLEEAQKLYPDNVIAALLSAEVYDRMGNISRANDERIKFLKKSSHAPLLARETMTWEDRKIIYDYTAMKLRLRGVKLPKISGLGEIPLIQKLVWEETNLLRECIVVGLPMIVIVGFGFFLWRIMTGAEIGYGAANKTILEFYLLFVLMYGVWMMHLFLNLPRLIDPAELEILAILVVGSVIIFFRRGYEAFKKRKEELSDPSAAKCPHCGKIIAGIVTECPYCKKKSG